VFNLFSVMIAQSSLTRLVVWDLGDILALGWG